MDHVILLGKPKLYGVSPQSLNWFQSYLSDRKQKTFIDGVQSNFCNITCGIPQGSILSYSLFILMISPRAICFQNPECMQMTLPLPHLQKTHVSLNIK